ncbi:hypothetical protein G5I_07975 [Acromyrmex echinatior]|uniref:Uncharacterized protein n=1 Tax=Acromyrmex echinatior TaxID=103372 RepID=F4WQ91_ACREC|nr:hypothetical protein G5I_07975 [Acromyrmex echinatior]
MSLRSPARPFSLAVRGSKIYAAGAKSRRKRDREKRHSAALVSTRCRDNVLQNVFQTQPRNGSWTLKLIYLREQPRVSHTFSDLCDAGMKTAEQEFTATRAHCKSRNKSAINLCSLDASDWRFNLFLVLPRVHWWNGDKLVCCRTHERTILKRQSLSIKENRTLELSLISNLTTLFYLAFFTLCIHEKKIGGAVAMSSSDRHDGSSREIGVELGESHRRRPVCNVFKELCAHIFKKDNE